MLYTVQKVAKLSGVTIKTLYHYQKIGLLMPEIIAENGYRYYGDKKLEKLQQILFYRELDFPLERIKVAMQNETSRLHCLCEQKSLLLARQQRLHRILQTIDEAINYAEKGVIMSKENMFNGLNKKEWEDVLKDQNEHLKYEYDYDMLGENEIQPEALNEHSDQVTTFINFMADSLKDGRRADDREVTEVIMRHIEYVNDNICPTTAQSFLEEAEFFLSDDFHRNMYENRQTGLSYYIFAAAKMYVEQQSK